MSRTPMYNVRLSDFKGLRTDGNALSNFVVALVGMLLVVAVIGGGLLYELRDIKGQLIELPAAQCQQLSLAED
jgi:hypothetical protein